MEKLLRPWAFLIRSAACLAALVYPAIAQFGPTQTLFRNSVASWTGTVDVHGVASGTVAGQAGTTETYTSDQHFSGNLKLDTYNPLTGAWEGTLDGTISVNETSS